MITRKRKEKSDTDKRDKGGVKKTRTSVVGARRSLNMAATTNPNITAMAPRNAAKRSASVTTIKTTNNNTSTKTVSKGGAKKNCEPRRY